MLKITENFMTDFMRELVKKNVYYENAETKIVCYSSECLVSLNL